MNGGPRADVGGLGSRDSSRRRARVAVGRASVDQAAERERITRNRYDAGLASVNDVLAAATARLDAEVERVAALVDALIASASLTRAVGWPVSPSRP
jgi:outer membrane protein TolC